MKSSMVEFSTDNKETLNRMAKKFNSKEYNIVSYQLDEKRLGEVTTYYVTMVIKSKKYNDEGMLLTLLQDFSDITVHRLEYAFPAWFKSSRGERLLKDSLPCAVIMLLTA